MDFELENNFGLSLTNDEGSPPSAMEVYTRLAEQIADPAYAPTRACELDVGRPKYHVIRFQIVAPSTAASNTNN